MFIDIRAETFILSLQCPSLSLSVSLSVFPPVRSPIVSRPYVLKCSILDVNLKYVNLIKLI